MLQRLADYLAYDLFRIQQGTQLGSSVSFFLYDVPKILFLLVIVSFVVSIIRSFLPQERIRAILGSKRSIIGNILASTLGIFMPFCTCSAIPLFLGMIQAGVPLGVTMSFLIASPMINEIAMILLWGLFGWEVAVTYIASGMVISITAGYIIGKLNMEKYIEKLPETGFLSCADETTLLTWAARMTNALTYSVEIIQYVWIYVILGISIGALIHGFIPGDILLKYAGKDNPFAVIIAVLIGVPIYANCAGAIPVIQALMAKGLPLGTTLAFLMAVTGLSLPEFLILRKIMKPKLLFAFFGIVALGIILTGYLFNFIF